MKEPMTNSKTHPLVSFLVCQTLCFSVAFLGSQATMLGLPTWYPALNKPAFNPPGWVFAPVWTVLYFLMGLALWQIWRSEPSRGRSRAIAIFAVQLVLNALWSWLFFAWHQLALSFYEIVALDVAILATIVFFSKVRNSAAWLLVPYLAWSCFASVLTFTIWRLNPTHADPKSADVQIRIEDPQSGPLLGGS